MLEQMKQNETLKTWFDCHNELEFDQVEEYAAALTTDTKQENNRRRSAKLSRAGAKKKGSTSEKPKLVFPFKADEEQFHAAASDLNELKEARDLASASSERKTIMPQDSDLKEQPQAENETEIVKGSARTHYITIRDDDINRLEPGEFLNDSLVDFWMKW